MASERKFINENIRRVLLKEYFQKETEMAGFGGIDIQRTPMGTRVSLIVERPGMVIGRKGSKIKELTRTVADVYGFDNPQIEVQECRNSSKNAQIMAQKLALALERGWHFRRAGHSTLRRVMDTDVKGCQVKLSGKLTGQRHRTEKFKRGHIKFCGEPALTTMERGYAIAKKKLGLIGVSVDIMKSDAKLPDEVIIHDIPELLDTTTEKGEYEIEAEKAIEDEDELPKEIVAEKETDIEDMEEEPSDDTLQKPEEEEVEDTKPVSKRKARREERRKDPEEDTSKDDPPPDKVEVSEDENSDKDEKIEKGSPEKDSHPSKAPDQGGDE